MICVYTAIEITIAVYLLKKEWDYTYSYIHSKLKLLVINNTYKNQWCVTYIFENTMTLYCVAVY